MTRKRNSFYKNLLAGKGEFKLEHLLILIQKDFLIWRNSYWRTGKQAATTLVVAVIVILVVSLIIRALLGWFIPITDAFPDAFKAEMLSTLVLLLLTWQFVSAFFATIQLSRDNFFFTPDLALLIATPTNPKIIFTLRYLVFTFLTPFTFMEIAIFGVAPLVALGLLVGAPTSYFVLLLPIIYLYRIIPTALAVALHMTLIDVLSPRRFYKVLAIVNFLLGGLPFYFFFSGQQELLIRWATQLANAEFVLWILPFLAAVRDLIVTLMGGDGGIWLPLFILVISIVIFASLGLAVVQRLYFRNYERLQTAEMRTSKNNKLKQDKAGAVSFAKLPIIWFLILEHWKPAVRNREMLPAGILFITLLSVYVILIEGFAGGQLWVMLLNVSAVAFCAQSATLILFIPLAMAEDRFAMQRQYWFYKIAPIGGKTFAGSLYLSHFLPALILALALIIPVNYFTDFASAGILQMALLTLLLVSSGALQQLTMLMEVSSIGEEATLFSRIAREATILYFPLFMLPLAISFYYRYIGLLSFMHGLPQPAVIVFAALITAILATVVTWQSFRNMTTTW